MNRFEDVHDVAARWVLRRDEPTWSDSDEAELEAWLDESITNKIAYWRLDHGWRRTERLQALKAPSVAPARARRWEVPLAAAASLAIASILPAAYFLSSPEAPRASPAQTESFATAVGARKTITLTDGSKVELNTDTEVSASVSSAKREFWLDRGEAFFEVVRAPTVPFVVYVAGKRVVVLGTKFSILTDGTKLTVGVLEGRVTIDRVGHGTPMLSTTIETGDIAVAEGRTTMVVSNSVQQVENNASWRTGILTFRDASLVEVANQFNRYNKRKLIVRPEIKDIKIGGSFQAANVDAFVRLIGQDYGLKTKPTAAGDIEIGSANS